MPGSNESSFSVEDDMDSFLGLNPTARALEAFATAADDIVAYAQDNAPWNDITGEARYGLGAEVYELNGEVVLDLYHSVEYGIFLETIQNGRFAIIMPTLELFAPQVFAEAGGRVTSETAGDE